MALSFDRFALPNDLPLCPCAYCGEPVESTDARGRCDDCGSDPLLAAHDEVSTFDFAVALQLGALSFARRTAHDPVDACGCDLCDAAREELNEWLDARRADFLAAVAATPVPGEALPWQLAWAPASNDDCDAAGAA